MYSNNFVRVYRNNAQLANDWANSGGNKTRSTFPGWAVLDKAAEEKLTGKFNTKKSNLCSKCSTFRSVSGTCLCD